MSKWKMVKLGDVGLIVTGNTPPTKNSEYYENMDIPFYKPNDLKEDTVSKLNIAYMSVDNRAKEKLRVLPMNSILVTCIGIIGKVGISTNVECATNQQINAIIPNCELCDSMYLAYVIFSKQKYMQDIANAPVVPIINKSDFSQIEIPLPPLDEQKKIAAELDKINELIAKRKKQIEKLDLLVKSQFVEMFGDNNFKTKVLKDMCLKITDGTHQSPEFIQYGIPFLFISNIVNNKIVYETNKFISEEEYNILIKRTPIEIGDILLTTVGSYGNPAIVETEYKFCFQRHIGYIKPKKELLNSYFLKYYFISPKGKEEMENRVKGIAQKTLNLSELKNIPIQLPPMSLQIKFADFATEVEQTKGKMQIALSKLETLYKARMQEYFS